MTKLILDHTVLAAMGTHRQVSAIVAGASYYIDQTVRVPAMCLAAAEAERSGLTRHVRYLPALQVVDLTTRDTGIVGALIALGVDWRNAHAVAVAREYSAPVVTLDAEGYESFGVETITLKAN